MENFPIKSAKPTKAEKKKRILDKATPAELADFSIKKNRDFYKSFPRRLPTFGKMPLPPDEHKHIGMYESKQTLYLLIAHAYNTIMDRLDEFDKSVQKG